MVFVPRRFEPALLTESPRATEPCQRLGLGKSRVMLTGWSGYRASGELAVCQASVLTKPSHRCSPTNDRGFGGNGERR